MITPELATQLAKSVQLYSKISSTLVQIANQSIYKSFTDSVRKLCDDHTNHSEQASKKCTFSKSSKRKRKKLILLKESLKMVTNQISKLYDFS